MKSKLLTAFFIIIALCSCKKQQTTAHLNVTVDASPRFKNSSLLSQGVCVIIVNLDPNSSNPQAYQQTSESGDSVTLDMGSAIPCDCVNSGSYSLWTQAYIFAPNNQLPGGGSIISQVYSNTQNINIQGGSDQTITVYP